MTKETTHVRIDREVKALLEAQAGPGESVNDVIRRLVTGGPAPVNEQVNREVNFSPADLEELVNKAVNHKLTALEERLDTLTKTIDQFELQQAKEPQTTPDQPDHHLTTQCSQENEQVDPVSVHDFRQYNNNVPTKKETCSQKKYTSTIQINHEIRTCLITKLDSLKSQGMSYRQISEAAGLASKGRITEIKNGKCKSLKESEYQTLMSM